ncbi:MAG TPA: hypothetical protein VMT15_07920 [Bryobacteraceae bacterium]|nr:hypothetical protein [Bryobacteraceae bacterium]
MKKGMFVAVACLGMAIGLASAASAQSLESMKVKFPVDAKVGNISLPAGTYSITELTNSVLEIRSDNKKGPSAFVTVMTVAARKPADKSKVVLKKEGDAYQVDTIWLEGQELGFELTTAAE